ncbi:MAG: acyl-CoA thioesterase [Cyanosarcina radialis HA8281-LM2]|nr:acyl-CoA thioesterase [Cyanosarcina radialis HA8281-LM2]
MSFTYSRQIRFRDTDAAGVVYFANVLAMCHEAYEESLIASGINLKSFFTTPSVAIPIVRAEVDFLRPMFCGDRISIELTPKPLNIDTFEINYQLLTTDKNSLLAKASSKHICIDAVTRKRQELPTEISRWLELYR